MLNIPVLAVFGNREPLVICVLYSYRGIQRIITVYGFETGKDHFIDDFLGFGLEGRVCGGWR